MISTWSWENSFSGGKMRVARFFQLPVLITQSRNSVLLRIEIVAVMIIYTEPVALNRRLLGLAKLKLTWPVAKSAIRVLKDLIRQVSIPCA